MTQRVRATSSRRRPSPGSAVAVSKDNVYPVGRDGFIYALAGFALYRERPPTAALLISENATPFRVWVGGHEARVGAAFVPPAVARSVVAERVRLVSFHARPGSPYFIPLATAGMVTLSRSAFRAFDEPLRQLCRGELDGSEAANTYEAVLEHGMRAASLAVRPDSRATRICRLLEANPDLTLRDLAREFDISYHWMSRLFVELIGVSLRDYKTWHKQQQVFELLRSKLSLTEVAHSAGFADSAHFSRTYQRWYGRRPSFHRNHRLVQVFRGG